MALPAPLVRPAPKVQPSPRSTSPSLAALVIAGALLPGCVFDWNSLRDSGSDVVGREDVSTADTGTDATDIAQDRGQTDAADVRSDVPTDVPVPPDVPMPDVPMDTPIDRPIAPDGGTDVPIDRPTDVPIPPVDVGFDAGTDVPPLADGGCTPMLVLNEVAVAGALGAADEFVEIYNVNNCDISLAGWTLRYLSSAGITPVTLWTGLATERTTGNGYAVIGGMGYTGAVNGRVTAGGPTGQLAAGGGGVGVFAPGAATPMDSMGYGTATNPFVEMMPTGAPSATQSASRTPNGRDTGNNSVDFTLRAATPGATN